MRMLDSITAGNLPDGADAYLGYVDGRWPTFAALKALFPHAHLLSMAVFTRDDATGCDREPGDLDADQIAAWTNRQLARGVHRPVCYASAANMPACLDALEAGKIGRGAVRLLSAHYATRNGAHWKHICGPATCAYRDGSGRVVPACDGTQWTDQAPGNNGSKIDESLLLPDFFDGSDMAITDADAKKIAREVWRVDGVIPGPDHNPANPDWEPRRVLADLGAQMRRLEAQVVQLTAAVLAKGPAGP